jgi:hypothetical protein
VKYPRKGLKPETFAVPLLEIARNILPNIEFPAVVKAEADRIVVTFYGNYREKHKVAVETLLKRLDETGRNVPASWLGNRRIEVRFKYAWTYSWKCDYSSRRNQVKF